MEKVFNLVYVILVATAIVATAEAARRKRRIPLRNCQTLVLYLVVSAFLPIAFLFGYAGGGWVGLALSAPLMSGFGLQNEAATTFGFVVGVFLGSYLIGIVGVWAGILGARLVGKFKQTQAR